MKSGFQTGGSVEKEGKGKDGPGEASVHLLSSGSIHWDTDTKRRSRNNGTKSEFRFQWITFWILSNIEMKTFRRPVDYGDVKL